MPEVLSTRALNRATLARQWLLVRQEVSALQALAHLVGLQAQASAPPYFGLWCRLEAFQAEELSNLLLNGQAARLALLRNTVHLVSAADALPLRALVQPIMNRDLRTNTTYAPPLAGLNLAELAARGRELLSGEALTLPKLRPKLAALYPERDPTALSHALRNLLPLVQVPPRGVWGGGGQVKYMTAQGWLGRELDVQPSLDELVLRYLRAFGPASVQDAQQWCGLTRLGEVFERLRPQLVTFSSEAGAELFDLPGAPRLPEDTPAPVRLLPAFDNLLLSHVDRRRIMDADAQARVFGVRNGIIPNTLLVDGFVVGTWSIEIKKKAASIVIEPYRILTKAAVSEVQAEAKRLLSLAAPDAEGQVQVIQP